MQDEKKSSPNFFIDYHDADLPWAEWIAWQLIDAHYTVVYRNRDFRPSSNIVQKTEQMVKIAERILIVLSPDYLKAYATGKTFSGVPVWTTTLFKDPSGQKRKLLPIRVRTCHPKGLLEPIIPINLVGLDEPRARNILLAGVNWERPVPIEKPAFPGAIEKADTPKPIFPSKYRPPIWHIPRDNPFFTDRVNDLTKLYEILKAGPDGRVHTHMINGLSGIGKTQVALAYAHNYRHHYEAVFWVDASDSSSLVSGIAHLATLLKLKPSKIENQNESRVIELVKQWLEEHNNWLLILDNIEDLRSVQGIVPSLGNGHVLLTAQTQATGTIVSSSFSIDELKEEDGALLLLRRAKKIEAYDTLEHAADSNHETALKLSRTLGNLPLMLDQAGAYIEDTGIDVLSYIEYYRNSTLRHDLLHWRGSMTFDHPNPVVETWNHAFEAVQQANVVAYDLLRFCAFLHPEAIPEEIITSGAAELLPTLQPLIHNPMQKDQAFATLRKYSLLYQNPTNRTLSINRMVQVVLKDRMSVAEQRLWAERAIKAVHQAFLAAETLGTVSLIGERCPRYFSHVQACASYIEDWNIATAEAALLLYRMGVYLHDYTQQVHSENVELAHLHITDALESYAALLKKMNRIEEATELTAYASILQATNASSV